MNPDENIDARIWDYLDGHSSAEERAAVELLLQTDPQWQEGFAQLQLFQAQLSAIPLQQPSMRFSKNVMETILHSSLPSPQRLISKRIIYGIAAVFILLLGWGLVQGIAHWGAGASGSTDVRLPSLALSWSAPAIDTSRLLEFSIGALIIGLLIFIDALLRHRNRGSAFLR